MTDEKIVLPRERVLELRALEQTVRACRAEHALTTANLKEAEAAHVAFANAIGAELVDGGKYEITSTLDLATGVVTRKPVAAERRFGDLKAD